jgi:chitin synthase
MFATIFVTVKSVQSELKKGFKASDLFQNKTFSTLILSMLSTYVLWFVVSFLFFDAWHMFTSFIQYLLLTPTYINILNVYAMCNTHDLSWGTKGAESAPGGGSVKSGKNSSEVEVVVPADPNTQYDNELELLALVGPVPPKPMTDEEKMKAEASEKEAEKKAKYQILRTWVVMGWLFSNLGLITAVLRAGSIGIVNDKAITKEAAESRNTGTYLFVVLWSVAGLSAFRFMGSCWFLVHRKVSL